MSAYSRGITSYHCFLIIVLTVVKANPISIGCGSTGSDTEYQKSVGQLMAALYETTSESGFSVLELGDLYGYALCRGDVSSTDCFNCMGVATTDIQTYCPTSQDAYIYYDYCYLRFQLHRYSYDSNIYYCLAGDRHVGDPLEVQRILSDLFIPSIQLAPTKEKYYDSRYITDRDEIILYGYVQCFNDMSEDNCGNCLNDLMNQLLNSCTRDQIGGRLVGGSCILRYEKYNFVN